MNYLAHLVLSGDDPEILFGNFIGDSVKGNIQQQFSEKIKLGIELHRKIDSFTDHHVLVHQAKAYFVAQFDKYSGVIVDILFDHFLARKFNLFSSDSLPEFSNKVISELEKKKNLFPEGADLFFQYMKKNDVPVIYQDIKGIEKVLEGMTYRIKNRYDLVKAIPILLENYDKLEDIFLDFYPQLKKFVETFLTEHK